MSVKINYEYDTVTIPAKAVAALERASGADIRLLMALCTNAELRCHPESDLAAFAAAAGCSEAQAAASLAFWRGVGVIVIDGSVGRVSDLLQRADALNEEPDPSPSLPEETSGPAESAVYPASPVKETISDRAEPITDLPVVERVTQQNDEPEEPFAEPAGGRSKRRQGRSSARAGGKKAKPERRDQLPDYTTDQINQYLEANAGTAGFLEDCQAVWGKMFNTHEINIVLGLVDYLGVSWDYVLILLSYCRRLSERRGSTKSLHYVETVAFSFYDDGVCEAGELQDKLRKMESMAEAEGQLRTLFGMGSRSLSTTEKRIFSAWLYDFEYGIDIIRRAYEIAVDAIGEPKIKYINSILSSWHSHDLRSLEAINAFVQEGNRVRGKEKHDTARQVGSSFETNDFFDAAVRRNFGEDGDHTGADTATDETRPDQP